MRVKSQFKKKALLCMTALCMATASANMVVEPAFAGQKQSVASSYQTVPVGRSAIVNLPQSMAEVIVANPEIADVHAHNSTTLTIVGKRLGNTNVRVFDNKGKLLRDFVVTVGHDLPAIRRALKKFLPDETISVDMVNTSIALTGYVSGAAAADRALTIVKDFISTAYGSENARSAINTASTGDNNMSPADANESPRDTSVLNMLQVTSGQQVMLRVRVGEINRTALKSLGVDMNANISGDFTFATGPSGITGWLDNDIGNGAGSFGYPTTANGFPSNAQGILVGRVTSGNNKIFGVSLNALERDGLFKVLAEPNLVAVSGEVADFLAGGEIPIPVVSGSGSGATAGVEYREFGVAVKFAPTVLSPSRIRMTVQPEVSELSNSTSVTIGGVSVPGITTRRAKTTIELAPGESFMIAGLIKDQSSANIDQLPGMRELPVLGSLFRSTSFQRSETELVIAVTPYIVDPMKSSDVKLPTDNFIPPSQADMLFFGSLTGNRFPMSHSSPAEGAIGFMVD